MTQKSEQELSSLTWVIYYGLFYQPVPQSSFLWKQDLL